METAPAQILPLKNLRNNPDLGLLLENARIYREQPKREELRDNPDLSILLKNARKYSRVKEKKSRGSSWPRRMVLAGTLATAAIGTGFLERDALGLAAHAQANKIQAPDVVYDPNKIFPASSRSPSPTSTPTEMPTPSPTPEPTPTPVPTIEPRILTENAQKEVGNRNIAEYFLGNLTEQFKQKRLEKFKNDPEFAKRVRKEFLNSNTINMLYLGVDEDRSQTAFSGEGLGRADSIILLSFDPHTFKTVAISIARDTYAPELAKYFSDPKINTMTMINEVATDVDSNELVKKIVEDAIGLPVDLIVKTNVDFMQGGGTDSILDQLFPNGLEIDVPKTLTRDGEVIYKAGKQRMKGAEATAWARIRSTDNDFARAERQRLLVQIIMKNLLPNIMGDFARGDAKTLDKMVEALEKEKEVKNLFYDIDVIEIIKTMRDSLNKLRSTPQGIATLAILGTNSIGAVQNFIDSKDGMFVTFGLGYGNTDYSLVNAGYPGSTLKLAGSNINSAPILYWDPLRKRIFELLTK